MIKTRPVGYRQSYSETEDERMDFALTQIRFWRLVCQLCQSQGCLLLWEWIRDEILHRRSTP